VVFTPTRRDTLKLMVGASARRGGEEELWAEWVRNGTKPKPETLTSYEISYSRELSRRWRASINGFYQDYDAIGWIPSLYYSSAIGRFEIAGGEFELTYAGRHTRVTLSEGISRLARSSLPPTLPSAGQTVTAAPYGYGNDLAEWAPAVTKIAITHELNDRWSVSSSAVHYSGFPGAKD